MLIVPLHLQLGEMLVTHRDFFYTVHHEFLVKAKACLENRDPFGVPLVQKGFVYLKKVQSLASILLRQSASIPLSLIWAS